MTRKESGRLLEWVCKKGGQLTSEPARRRASGRLREKEDWKSVVVRLLLELDLCEVDDADAHPWHARGHGLFGR